MSRAFQELSTTALNVENGSLVGHVGLGLSNLALRRSLLIPHDTVNLLDW